MLYNDAKMQRVQSRLKHVDKAIARGVFVHALVARVEYVHGVSRGTFQAALNLVEQFDQYSPHVLYRRDLAFIQKP